MRRCGRGRRPAETPLKRHAGTGCGAQARGRQVHQATGGRAGRVEMENGHVLVGRPTWEWEFAETISCTIFQCLGMQDHHLRMGMGKQAMGGEQREKM